MITTTYDRKAHGLSLFAAYKEASEDLNNLNWATESEWEVAEDRLANAEYLLRAFLDDNWMLAPQDQTGTGTLTRDDPRWVWVPTCQHEDDWWDGSDYAEDQRPAFRPLVAAS